MQVNEIGKRITFKIKTGYYIELLTPETMKPIGSTKSKITKKQKWWKCALFRICWSSISPF